MEKDLLQNCMKSNYHSIIQIMMLQILEIEETYEKEIRRMLLWIILKSETSQHLLIIEINRILQHQLINRNLHRKETTQHLLSLENMMNQRKDLIINHAQSLMMIQKNQRHLIDQTLMIIEQNLTLNFLEIQLIQELQTQHYLFILTGIKLSSTNFLENAKTQESFMISASKTMENSTLMKIYLQNLENSNKSCEFFQRSMKTGLNNNKLQIILKLL